MSTLKAANISNLASSSVATTDRVINGSAFAWVNFNGTGTIAIQSSYNVSSLTRNATGDYTINLSAVALSATYASSGQVNSYAGGVGIFNKTTSTFRIQTYSASALTDFTDVNALIFS